MTETHPIRIALSESKGAFPGGPQPLSDGSIVHTVAWGSTCPGCEKVPTAGQQITKIFHAWWHATCGVAYLRSTAADEAWLALAHQLERSPSKFNNAETKAITRNLLRIAGRSFMIPEHGYNDRARGARLLAAVPTDETQFADVIGGFHGSDLYAAVMQAEQRIGGEVAVHVGAYAWDLLDNTQRETHLPELLHAYVELVRRERDDQDS